MSAELWLYLISVLHNINHVVEIVFMISLIGVLVSFIVWGVCSDDEYDARGREFARRSIKMCLLLICIATPLLIIIPDQKTMYAMLTTNIMKQSDIPERVLNILDAKLGEYEGKHDK